MAKFRRIFGFVIFSISVTQTGCITDYFYSGFSNPVRSAQPGIVPPSPSPMPSTNISIRTIQPALAVRGASCLMCHANIQANVITDFGYGDPWFMGSPNTDFSSDTSWFNNYLYSWQTTQQIQGQVFIPDVQIQSSLMGGGASLSPSLKIADVFNISPTVNLGWGDPFGVRTYSTLDKPMTVNIFPTSGRPPVVPMQEILIRAPSSSEILSLVPEFQANPTQVGFKQMTNSPYSNLSAGMPSANFVAIGTGQSQAITNPSGSNLNCYGDVVINGPLFLNQAQVATDSNGCRLYVNGSVFIQGGITYVANATDKPNLQISSSRAIIMGIGTSSNPAYNSVISVGLPTAITTISPLYHRLFEDHRNPHLRGTDWNDFASLVYGDAQAVVAANGGNQLLDAQDPLSPGFDPSQNRASIDVTGLLLNARVVESRYLGLFKGTIVSEIALFGLGSFYFDYDPVFNTAPALPLLPTDILNVN